MCSKRQAGGSHGECPVALLRSWFFADREQATSPALLLGLPPKHTALKLRTALFISVHGFYEDISRSTWLTAIMHNWQTRIWLLAGALCIEDPRGGAVPGICLPGPALGHLCVLHHSLAGVLITTCKTQVSWTRKHTHGREEARSLP